MSIKQMTAMAVFVLLNIGDVIVTTYGLRSGTLVESNPLMTAIVEHVWSAVLVKTIALGFAGWLIWNLKSKIKLVNMALTMGICWYSFVLAWNLRIVL